MRTNQYPPMVKDAPSPDQLIGAHLLYDFKKHYKLAYRSNPLDFEASIKSIPDHTRSKIIQAYMLLRSAGYYPTGVDERDNIIWKYVTDSRPSQAREFEGIDFTKEQVLQLRKEAREYVPKNFKYILCKKK